MNFIIEYGLFLAQIATIVLAIIVVTSFIVGAVTKGKTREKLIVEKMNQKYQAMADTLNAEILDKKQRRQKLKQLKKDLKTRKSKKHNIFVLHFKGDIKASAVESLRQEITAVLAVATIQDEVVVILDSPGGMVNGYGLAASQLQRIKDKQIPLTVCVDKVAASGGYLMSCVADQIFAAPFAIIGSIGVVAQIPNFHRFLKKHNIDFEQLTAGEYKRTLTLFGENTDKARSKFQEDIEDIQRSFKEFVREHRPRLDIDTVATGEHWLANKAYQLGLVDKLITSDDYLLEASQKMNLFEVSYRRKLGFIDKFSTAVKLTLEKCMDYWWDKNNNKMY